MLPVISAAAYLAGAAGAALASVAFMGETMTPARALFLGLLIVSIIGLKFTSAH